MDLSPLNFGALWYESWTAFSLLYLYQAHFFCSGFLFRCWSMYYMCKQAYLCWLTFLSMSTGSTKCSILGIGSVFTTGTNVQSCLFEELLVLQVCKQKHNIKMWKTAELSAEHKNIYIQEMIAVKLLYLPSEVRDIRHNQCWLVWFVLWCGCYFSGEKDFLL